jgi:hypothetical protein
MTTKEEIAELIKDSYMEGGINALSFLSVLHRPVEFTTKSGH